jgi:hypothetical protein
VHYYRFSLHFCVLPEFFFHWVQRQIPVLTFWEQLDYYYSHYYYKKKKKKKQSTVITCREVRKVRREREGERMIICRFFFFLRQSYFYFAHIYLDCSASVTPITHYFYCTYYLNDFIKKYFSAKDSRAHL